jgi:hypothetical protein
MTGEPYRGSRLALLVLTLTTSLGLLVATLVWCLW